MIPWGDAPRGTDSRPMRSCGGSRDLADLDRIPRIRPADARPGFGRLPPQVARGRPQGGPWLVGSLDHAGAAVRGVRLLLLRAPLAGHRPDARRDRADGP